MLKKYCKIFYLPQDVDLINQSIYLMTFNEFVHKCKTKKATSNIKIHQILSSVGLNKVGIYLRDAPFKSDIGIVSLHQSKGTHCVTYVNENCFDSFGCVPSQKLSNYLKKTIRTLFMFWIQYTRSDKWTRFFFVQVLFYICFTWQKRWVMISNLLFWNYTIKWVNNVDVFFKVNDIEKNNYW